MSTPNIVVTNASPIIHLARANHLDVLLNIYDKIYCAEAAARDIQRPDKAVEFVQMFTTVMKVQNRGLVDSIKKAHPKLELGEIETFALYKETGAQEALFLNTKAQNVFREEYKAAIRDIIQLPEIDTGKKAFRNDHEINAYYISLEKIVPGYKPLVKILKERGLRI